jgi:sugar transferase (PEP-CTERM/EpsH1 system associated)
MHVVYRFDVGGLENGVVNLVNGLPEDEFRHMVVALTECVPAFCRRIDREDVGFVSLGKPPGHGWRVFAPFWRLCRRERPAIVHTRNLAALEMQVPAACARVPGRIHGEHGRDLSDPAGASRKYRILRRTLSPFVIQYVALSRDLAQYLTDSVGIEAARVTCLPNGVDERRFAPRARRAASDTEGHPRPVVIGSVGRLEGVKGHRTLIAAVARLVADGGVDRRAVRVRLVGDGPLREMLAQDIEQAGLGGVVELLGERNDVDEIMRQFDVFVLPSLAEGISNTVLEAMASGLPVVATDVGGNAELVDHGTTGLLVPANDPTALAEGMARYVGSALLRETHGQSARARVEREFALSRMIERYRELYRAALGHAPAALWTV